MGKYQVLSILCLLAITMAVPSQYYATPQAYCADVISLVEPGSPYITKIFSEYDNLCATCSRGATGCTTPNTATGCQSGFLKQKGDGDSLYCEYYNDDDNCMDACADFSAGEYKCKQCAAGMAVFEGNCYDCSKTGCLTCSTTDAATFSCSKCAEGYFLSGGSCTPCGTNAATCTSADVALTCKPGFGLKAGKCDTACTGNCLTCTGDLPAKCLSCKADKRYFYDSTAQTCTECAQQAGCLECKNEAAKCSRCAQGFGPKADDTCYTCGNNKIISCTITGDVITPTVCQLGYVLKNNACKQLPEGCKVINNDGKCTSCITGLVLSEGTCLSPYAVLEGCKTAAGGSATDKATCSACIDGFWKESASKCTLCTNNCATCTAADKCSSCVVGYHLTTDTCQVNTILNCIANGATCDKCRTGFYVSADKLSCVAWSTAPTTPITDCTTYESTTTCRSCTANKIPATDKKTCVAAPTFTNCDLTDDLGTKCLLCDVGYKKASGSATDCTLCKTDKSCAATTCSTVSAYNPYTGGSVDNGDGTGTGTNSNIMHFSFAVLALLSLLF